MNGTKLLLMRNSSHHADETLRGDGRGADGAKDHEPETRFAT